MNYEEMMEKKIFYETGEHLSEDVLEDLIFIDKHSQREPNEEDFDRNGKLVYMGKVYRFIPENIASWAGRLVQWSKLNNSKEDSEE